MTHPNTPSTKATPLTFSDGADPALPARDTGADRTADAGTDVGDAREYRSFDDMPLHAHVLRGIYSAGFERPSPIQRQAIVPMLKGGDVIAQAQSGTGKTGAFAIGILHRIQPHLRCTQAIVLSPTRELAEQTYEVVLSLGEFVAQECAAAHLAALFVGKSSSRADDVRMLAAGVVIAVGTPGRVHDHIARGALRASTLKTIVLDEADEMLSQGFAPQVQEIFRYLPRDIQVGLFSATMPPEVLALSSHFMRDPTRVLVPATELTLRGIKQFHVALEDDETKLLAMMDLFEQVSIAQSVIFVNSRKRVEWLSVELTAQHHSVAAIHAAMDAAERNRVMRTFRRGLTRVLVCTDLLARGIDVQHVNYVINFDVPLNKESYLHRIGRSGRLGRRGIAINFVSPHEVGALRDIELHYATHIPELPENFSQYFDEE